MTSIIWNILLGRLNGRSTKPSTDLGADIGTAEVQSPAESTILETLNNYELPNDSGNGNNGYYE